MTEVVQQPFWTVDRSGRETLREREHGPTPWLTARQRNEMKQDMTILRYVSCYSGISRHGPLPLLPLSSRHGLQRSSECQWVRIIMLMIMIVDLGIHQWHYRSIGPLRNLSLTSPPASRFVSQVLQCIPRPRAVDLINLGEISSGVSVRST